MSNSISRGKSPTTFVLVFHFSAMQSIHRTDTSGARLGRHPTQSRGIVASSPIVMTKLSKLIHTAFTVEKWRRRRWNVKSLSSLMACMSRAVRGNTVGMDIHFSSKYRYKKMILQKLHNSSDFTIICMIICFVLFWARSPVFRKCERVSTIHVNQKYCIISVYVSAVQLFPLY